MNNILKEFCLSPVDCKKVQKRYDDLQVQAMLFDMDIDIETWSLTPKKKIEYTWLDRWLDKLNNSDRKHEYGE